MIESISIGDVASRTGLKAKTIRYYEEIELVAPIRAANGYRAYRGVDVDRLILIKRARCLGFSIDECRQLLSLHEDAGRASADVKALAIEKIAELDQKLIELQSLRATLKKLSDNCNGDEHADCAILNGLVSA